jgi:hypothetical protein
MFLPMRGADRIGGFAARLAGSEEGIAGPQPGDVLALADVAHSREAVVQGDSDNRGRWSSAAPVRLSRQVLWSRCNPLMLLRLDIGSFAAMSLIYRETIKLPKLNVVDSIPIARSNRACPS